jgi:hypothetical protein
VRHGLGLFLSNLLQVRLPACLIILLQGPSDGRVLLLSHLHLGLGQVGLGLRGLRLGPCGLRLGPCLRLGPAAFAGDSRLGCCSRPSPGFGASTSACLALDHEAAAREPPSAIALMLVTRAARGAARRPLHIEVHRLRLPSGRLRTIGPVSQGPWSLTVRRAR